jgi:glycerol-3-phosphate dehydrogenase
VDTLLAAVAGVLAEPLTRDDVLGTFTGLRPLLAGGSGGRSADLSRRHAVRIGSSGAATVVGGKLTTYRRMAEDAVDAVVAAGGLAAGPCRTRDLPLVAAAPPRTLASVAAPDRLVRRYGTEAPRVLAEGGREPVADGLAVTVAEVLFAVRHEGALEVDDVLHRRTRIGLVAEEAGRCRPVVAGIIAEVPRLGGFTR